ncbi:hypothetical protein COU01_01095 [Candidatus Falkowbacteria bacterium CG10_big_fil_rev_8_21_14_0_10_44_15]|uniref:CBM-cenC domain-containing protein n=1 Tax=Candidatus Falkowbacteria bacterium CG10_big_fil_rev_8_21_14_0_10_44_15 TaxID=1974569 RepID=A0A2H0V0E9_9BACT|nr:MAG: hypothetical protein COU01_01095 [Candidatus Falkowbacteria bacterium CG10_big_fil_rev_8_21_14_0_10_44_15]
MNMIQKIILALFVLVVFAAVSAVDVKAAEINVNDYFPLEVGRMWTYVAPGYSVVQVTVIETRDFPAGTGYVFQKNEFYFDNSGSEKTNRVYGRTSIGVGQFEYQRLDREYSIIYSPCLLMLPVNPRVGSPVINSVTVTHIGELIPGEYAYLSRPWSQNIEVIGLGETVVVPAGTFTDTIHIHITNDEGDDSHSWYAKGVGLIKGGLGELIAINELLPPFIVRAMLTPTVTVTPTAIATAVPTPTPTPTNTPAPALSPSPVHSPIREGFMLYENDISNGDLAANGITEVPGTFAGLAPAQISIESDGDVSTSAINSSGQNYILRLSASENSGSLLLFNLRWPLEVFSNEEVRVSVGVKGDATAQIFIGAIDADTNGNLTPVMEYLTTHPLREWETVTASHQSRSNKVVPLIQVVGPGSVTIDKIQVRVVNKDTF